MELDADKKEGDENKQRKKILKDTDIQHQSILDHISDVVFCLHVESGETFRFNYVNKSFLQATGLKKDQVIGKTFQEVLPKTAHNLALKNYHKAISEKKMVSWEETSVYPAGTKTGRVRVTPRFDENGKCTFLDGTVHDITEIKSARDKLEESNYWLNQAQKVSKIGYYVFDIKSGIWTNSDELNRIFGIGPDYKRDTEGWKQVIHPDFKDEMIAYLINEVIGKGKEFDREYKIISISDKKEKWVHGLGELHFGKDRKPVTMFGTIRDISKQKEAELALKQSEEKFQKAFHVSPDLIAITSVKTGKIIEANNSFTQKSGFTPEEYLGKTTVDLNIWVDSKDRECYFKMLQEKGRVNNMEFLFRTKQGEVRHCLVSGEYLQLNNERCIIAVIHDITDLKQSQINTENERLRLRTLIETIPDLVWLKGPEGKYLLCNHEFEKFFGAKEKFILGKTDYDFVDKKLADFFRNKDKEAMEAGKSIVNNEKVTYKDDGHKAILETIKTPVYDRDGNLIGVLGIARDVTELMELNENLEEKVNERTTQLESANKGLESFAYSVSHDLRAPLRHIDGFSKLLIESIRDNPDEADYLYAKINESILQMSTMIESLLQFSRLGRKTLNKTRVDVNKIIQEVVKQNEKETSERNITWEIGSIPEVSGDYNLLRFVFENLISNAVKFTSKEPQARIEIGACKSANKCTLFIRDNGVGFEMAYAHKLFNVFQRLHSQEEFEGVGIGLANVSQIIKKHGGSIAAEGQPGKGATFYITL